MSKSTILIQGALDIETQYVIDMLESKKSAQIHGGYEFWIGHIGDIQVIVSRTLVGVVNATIATCIGIIKFKPDLVINQGIAGAHTVDLHIGDIVIGEKCCNINAYKMPFKKPGEGSNPFEWEPNKRAKDVKLANHALIEWFRNNIVSGERKVCTGILGSGDLHSREYDRIVWLNQTFNNLCEDMESIGVYSACEKFDTPCLGVRIISNNDLLSEKLDKEQGIELQKIIINTIRKGIDITR